MWGHKRRKPVNQDAGSPHTRDPLAPWHRTSQPPEMEKYISFLRSLPVCDTLWKLPKQTKTGVKQTELEQMAPLAETQCPHAHGEAARLPRHLRRSVIGFPLSCLATIYAILFSACEDSTSFYSYLGFFTAPSSEPVITWETSGQRGDRKPSKTLASPPGGERDQACAYICVTWLCTGSICLMSKMKLSFLPSSQSLRVSSAPGTEGSLHAVPSPCPPSWSPGAQWLPGPWSLKVIFIMRSWFFPALSK